MWVISCILSCFAKLSCSNKYLHFDFACFQCSMCKILGNRVFSWDRLTRWFRQKLLELEHRLKMAINTDTLKSFFETQVSRTTLQLTTQLTYNNISLKSEVNSLSLQEDWKKNWPDYSILYVVYINNGKLTEYKTLTSASPVVYKNINLHTSPSGCWRPDCCCCWGCARWRGCPPVHPRCGRDAMRWARPPDRSTAEGKDGTALPQLSADPWG